nr:MAG TPA: NinB protein [Caudoviricetes sp.]
MKLIGNKNKIISWLLNQEENKIFEIKEYKEKRNLDQNGKYYKLLNELALTLKIGTEELHFEMLKNYSVRYQILIPKETELRGIKYYELKKTIKKDDKLFNIYEVYVPSHELKTDEFALLLNGLIEECKNQDIEVRSPSEIREELNIGVE